MMRLSRCQALSPHVATREVKGGKDVATMALPLFPRARRFGLSGSEAQNARYVCFMINFRKSKQCAPVAQRLEQQTHNLLVRGSNPCGGTN